MDQPVDPDKNQPPRARGLDPNPPAPKEKPFKFVVRLPLRLRHQIADAAKYYRRSMNSEIVDRLERSFNLAAANAPEEVAAAGDPLSPTQLEALFGRGLTGEEEQIVVAFRRLSREKQRAVLDLIS